MDGEDISKEKEQLNLRMLKNAIFKEENFINTIAIKSSTPSGTKTAHKNKTIINILVRL